MTSNTILVVDDSRVSRMLVRAIIDHADEQIEVIEASNGEEALSKTKETQVKVAILDLNMPGMDGLVLASKLLARFPKAKIGLLTANIQDIVREKAHALGITFIPKPITEERILGFIYG
ncbi:MAG TPA: response regulator [Gammaproteobacteria bacterium]|nr:response regulator [Candidatus Parabeggiatoa sp.]HAI69646.1 response regulator [Gammaproteobacteria bacterium]